MSSSVLPGQRSALYAQEELALLIARVAQAFILHVSYFKEKDKWLSKLCTM